ncbi:MAG: PAS domain-containing sensor histidine kinase, partial [Lachnospiraceae bacterium]|nr:PAS domain-containing sensor histidine kinase [Lachnospiraceae bacterium]
EQSEQPTVPDETIVNQNVLFIASYGYDWQPTREQIAGMEKMLDQSVNLRVVFMDTRNVPYERAVEALKSTLEVELEANRFDCIVAGDDAALRFMLEEGEAYFQGLPVVYQGINDPALAAEYEEVHPHSAGVIEAYYPEETIRLAEQISPQAEQIVVITDRYTSPDSIGLESDELKTLFPELKHEILNVSEYSAEDLKLQLASYDRSTILCYLSMRETLDGHDYTYGEFMSILRDYTNTPVYGLFDMGVGDGIFGGYLISQQEMGSMCAQIVMKVLNREEISDLEPAQVPAKYIFDYELLRKYHVSPNDLPKNYQAVNNPRQFLSRYRRAIEIMSVVIAILLMITLAMIVIWRREKHMQDVLETTQRELVEAIGRSGLFVWVYYPDEKKADLSYIDADAEEILRPHLSYQQGQIWMHMFPHSMIKMKFIHPDDAEKLQSTYARIDAGAERVECDYRALRSGGYTWEHMILNRIPTGRGKQRVVVGTAMNIQEKSILQGVVENTINHDYDFIALVNGSTEHMNIFQRNHHAEIGLGRLNVDEMIFDELREELINTMIPVKDRAHLLEETKLSSIHRELQEQVDYIVYFETKSGRYKRQRYTYLDPLTKDMIVTERDITNTVKKEHETSEQLRKALQKAEDATKSKSDFFSRVSHDMRTPLNGIISFTDFAMESRNASEKQEYLQKIRMSSDILLGLINHTLEISRFESGSAKLEMTKISGRRLLDDLATVIRPNAEAKNQDLYYETDFRPEEVFLVDKLRLQEVCLNLLSNAVKYTPSGGKVEFTAMHLPEGENQNYRIEIKVKDNGIGISEEMHD